MSTAVAELVDYQVPPVFAPVACDGSTSLGLGAGDFASPRTVTFTSPVKGNVGLRENVDCNTGSAQCELQ